MTLIPMRKYEPIWLALKKDGSVSITAPVSDHARIIQAVRKERWRDDVFRYSLAEAEKKAEIKEDVIGTVIKFRIDYSDTILIRSL